MSNIEEFHRKNTNRSAPKIHPKISAPTPQHNPLACSSVLSRSSVGEGRGRKVAHGGGARAGAARYLAGAARSRGEGAQRRAPRGRGAARGGARPRRTGTREAEGVRAARGGARTTGVRRVAEEARAGRHGGARTRRREEPVDHQSRAAGGGRGKQTRQNKESGGWAGRRFRVK
jgi:hypothetical protein